MFYVDPKIKPKFDSLSPELQQVIAEKDVELNSIYDLIKVLEEITSDPSVKD